MAHQIEDSGERNTVDLLTSSKDNIAPRKVGRPKGQKKLTTKYEKKSNFIGTWNSFPVNYLEVFKTEFTDFVCQEEIGLSGNHHVQFAGRTESKRSITAMAKRLKGAHLEFADNWIACLNYCSKQDTCIAGTHFEHGNAFEKRVVKDEKRKIADPMDGKEMKPWQEGIVKMLHSLPDPRKIFVYYDADGGQGKTSLAKHLCLNYPGVLYVNGKSADVKFAITESLNAGNEVKCVIMDFARSQEEYISYQALEEVKNGIFFNSKYESGMVMYDIPHLIVFSNFLPKMENLSADRWVIENIGNDDYGGYKHVPNAEEIDDNMDDIYLDLMMKISVGRRLSYDQQCVMNYYENMLRICYEPYTFK